MLEAVAVLVYDQSTSGVEHTLTAVLASDCNDSPANSAWHGGGPSQNLT
jgi:hypothetical protein